MVFHDQDILKFIIYSLNIDERETFQNHSKWWKVDVEQIILNDFQSLEILAPEFAAEIRKKQQDENQKNKLLDLQKVDTEKSNTDKTLLQMAKDLDQREINEDEPSLTQTSAYVDLCSIISEAFEIKAEVNNDGDLALLFIEKKNNKQAQKNSQEQKRESQGLDMELKISSFSNDKKTDNMNVSANPDVKEKKSRKDLKQRLFMIIKRSTNSKTVVYPSVDEGDQTTQKANNEVIIFSNKFEIQFAHFIKNFLLTREHLFFWNKQKIFYCNHAIETKQINLKNRFSNITHITNFKKISFQISTEDLKKNTILAVSASGLEDVDNNIVIKIGLTPKLNCIIVWDLKGDIEEDSYDVSVDAQVMFDAKGIIYILEHDHIILNDSGARCFSYQLDQSQGYLMNKQTGGKIQLFDKIDKGFRIDPINHNFLIVKNQIHLSHSYLGIFINEQQAQLEYTSRTFDPLAFPYYINKQSEIHHYVNDPSSLDQILQYYEENDQRLLDHILLVDSNMKTPMHFASANEITKSLNLLLKRLSIVRVNNTANLSDIFDDLLNFSFFEDYLNVCFFQTLQMKSIQSLNIPRISADDNDNGNRGINVIKLTNTFLNNKLIKKIQVDGSPNQPVIVKGFDLYWILNSSQGTNFLHKLTQISNTNIFTTEFIKTLIYFLWKYYKKRIILYIMAPFCMYFAFFIAFVFYNENNFNESDMTIVHSDKTLLSLAIITLVWIVYFYYILLRSCITLGWLCLKTVWVWLILMSNSLNLAIVLMTLCQQDSKEIRRIESVAVLLMWFRFLYFFRMFDQTAPLIRMIYQILYDIRSFIIIFFLVILAFANGFYFLAKNQENRDEEADIPYITYRKSIIYVYLASIGEYSTDQYTVGDDENLLWAFFVFTTFIISIVLLNMLIAMMGQSYERVSDLAEASMLRERILMIIENFFLSSPNAFKRAKYLVSFEPVKEQNQDEEMQEQIINKLNSLSKEVAALTNATINSNPSALKK